MDSTEHCKRVQTEGCLEIWEITTTTLRRGHPYTHTRTLRKCVFDIGHGNICNRTFDRKAGATKHIQTHQFKGNEVLPC